MRWRTGRRSGNVIDRRGRGGARRLAGGGIGTLVIILVALYFGVDPTPLLQGTNSVGVPSGASTGGTRGGDFEGDDLAAMTSVVFGYTEDVWEKIFAESGQVYRKPNLVLFSGSTRSACGLGQAAMGPFYCPADQQAYIDLSFYRDLRNQLGAPGDFAQAYVIAHEVGHHVQNLLGISGKVHAQRQRVSQVEGNALSVRLELQADCFSGVWANRADKMANIIEDGDVEEALNAAGAIGDDRLQRRSRGTVSPETFSHGTSEQRIRWFRTGLESGDPDRCDTFGAARL